jgi:ammonium transporter, Amt family
VLTLSAATFYAIKKTVGLRVTAEQEQAGLDISEHGMYGYPEQFIPDAELYGSTVPPSIKLNGHAPATAGSAEAAPA